MPILYGETVVVLDGTVTGQDADGNDARPYPEKATYTNVPVWPFDANGTGGNEYQDARDTVVAGLSVLLPDGADIGPTDRCRARGVVWEVVGDPQALNSFFTGWRPGVPVALRRVTG